jgi:(1->4)-alpha-D-glucan 1-alpha-D-glucosylmutase
VKEGNRFLPQLAAWVEKITPIGVANSLAQTVLRLTVPGVPDLYQGTEFWDFSLVDPDNRRPVDYAAREQALKDAPPFVTTLDGWQDGRVKQQVVRNLLALRAREPALFSRGDYQPLQIEGPMAEHAIAFMRRFENRAVLVIVSRLAGALLEAGSGPRVAVQAWKETRVALPEEAGVGWKDAITDKQVEAVMTRLPLAEVLSLVPVAVLANVG